MKKFFLIVLLITSCVQAETNLHVVWNKTPIDVVLPLGQERMLSFPASVKFGYDATALPDPILHVQNVGGTVYLFAKQAFVPTRVEVVLQSSGQVVLLNLSASQSGNDTPLTVVLPSQTTEAQNPSYADIEMVDLTRFAIHQLYAPKRLLQEIPGVMRVPMHIGKTIPLTFLDKVTAMPLISWQGNNAYVTGVLLRNQTTQIVQLTPQIFCGVWQAVALYPQAKLTPRGTLRDTTTAFFISSTPFATALQNCVISGSTA